MNHILLITAKGESNAQGFILRPSSDSGKAVKQSIIKLAMLINPPYMTPQSKKMADGK